MNPISWLKNLWIVPPDPRLEAQAEDRARQHFTSFSPKIAPIVIRILVEQLGVGISELMPTARFVEELKADELEPVEIVMAIEEEFKISIPDHEAEQILTVADLIEYVTRRKQC
jgi:acyl carrier protein